MSNIKYQISKKSAGFTLIEVLTALTAIVIVSTAVSTIMILSLSNAQHSEDTTLATRYMQEGMEAVREIRKNNYSLLTSYSGTYCLGNTSDGLTIRPPACNTPNVGGSFIRTVQVEHSPGCGARLAKVTVAVSWSDGKCSSSTVYCHMQSHSSCLSTVNLIPEP